MMWSKHDLTSIDNAIERREVDMRALQLTVKAQTDLLGNLVNNEYAAQLKLVIALRAAREKIAASFICTQTYPWACTLPVGHNGEHVNDVGTKWPQIGAAYKGPFDVTYEILHVVSASPIKCVVYNQKTKESNIVVDWDTIKNWVRIVPDSRFESWGTTPVPYPSYTLLLNEAQLNARIDASVDTLLDTFAIKSQIQPIPPSTLRQQINEVIRRSFIKPTNF